MLDSLAPYGRRLWEKRGLLAAFAVATLFYVTIGGLDPRWALVALTAALLVAALAPADPAVDMGVGTRRDAARQPGTRGERRLALPINLLDGLQDAALVVDGTLTIVAGNAAAHALVPVSSGRSLITWTRAPEVQAAVQDALKTGTLQRCSFRLNLPVERYMDVCAVPSASGAGDENVLVLITLRDLTDQEQLTRMRADFVANASHELRTPLASLRGFIETLQGAAKDDPGARARFLAIMQGQAERMSRLIDDLLSLSRIEMREHVPPTGSVDVAALIAEAARGLAPLADEAGIAIRLSPAIKPAVVTGDRDELIQVFQNLIQNAIKYGRKGGRVDVAVEHTGSRVVASIADDGIGIAPEHVPRLVERFYRVSAKDSKERGGTGLGLAIVKHIVNRHRGELRIASELGKGSVFTIVLPAAPARS